MGNEEVKLAPTLSLTSRLLVVGDIMLDRYTETEVRRISPEAPVPVASIIGRWSAPGGAANVARNLSSLGMAVTLVGVRSNDQDGQDLAALLDQHSIMAPAVLVNDRPTTCKSRILAGGQQLLRLDEEVCHKCDPVILDRVLQNVLHALPWAQAVVLSDYGKGLFAELGSGVHLASEIISRAHEQKKSVLVDPRGTDWSCYRASDCLTPNTRELATVVHRDPEDFEGLLREARDLMSTLEIARILITRGARGMTLIEADGDVTDIPTRAREVADVSGAGDTVIAVLAACIAEGRDWISSARLANLAAGIVVGKVGTSPVGRDELQSAMASDTNSLTCALNALSARIVNRERLLELVTEWRRLGQRIVFTNGCFDLVHPGHVELLQAAASFGDRLIVAVNSDASVRRLKGPDRPIQSENARALVMAGMNGVDAVVLFSEDTPLSLITMVAPDVLVKGGDYRRQDVVGADFVTERGGELRLVPIVDGYSTSSIVSNLQS